MINVKMVEQEVAEITKMASLCWLSLLLFK